MAILMAVLLLSYAATETLALEVQKETTVREETEQAVQTEAEQKETEQAAQTETGQEETEQAVQTEAEREEAETTVQTEGEQEKAEPTVQTEGEQEEAEPTVQTEAEQPAQTEEMQEEEIKMQPSVEENMPQSEDELGLDGLEDEMEDEIAQEEMEDEIALEKTRVIHAFDYEQYYEENRRLVEEYDGLVTSDTPYALRRIVGKMLVEIDLEQYGADVVLIGPDKSFLLQFDTEEKTEQAFLALSSLAQLKYCQLDKAMPNVEPVEEGDHIAQDNNWDTEMLELNKYLPYVKQQVGEESITVCVLDTGTDATHPYLRDKIKTGVTGASYTDMDGHGTHVAGIVARCAEGINIKILPIQGIGAWSLASSGTRLAVSQGVKVINMSFGTDYGYGFLGYIECDEDFHDAVEMAVNAGVSIVAAAGNNGHTDLRIDDYYECPSHFGVQDGIITVANVDMARKRASDSGYGSAVDIAAPGSEIYSTYLEHGYTYMGGTSMAAPHITAIVAMMRLMNPEKTPTEIENLLKSYCQDAGKKGRDDYYGYGIPKMSRAMNYKGKNHVWNEEYTIDKAPTCTESGTESIRCVDCNMIKPESTRTVNALGHDNRTTIVKATLKKSGTKLTVCERCNHMTEKKIYYPKTIQLARTTYQYTGKAKKPAVTVKDSKGKDIAASNYTVKYLGKRIEAGTYTVQIQFIGKYYTGTANRTFTIQDKRAIQKITTTDYNKVHGDEDFKIMAVLEVGNGTLSYESSDPNIAEISQDGIVTIKKAGKVGISITASGTSKYRETSAQSVLIIYPKPNKILSLSNTVPGQVKVKWEKTDEVSGYRVVYDTSAKFTNLKSSTYKNNRTGQKIITNLKKGQKYYVKVCTFITASDGKKYYSTWSPVRSITVKQ